MTVLAFTRPERRLRESVERAEGMGFKVIAAPSLDIHHGDPSDYKRTRDLLKKRTFSIVIFSSVTAAEECVKEWGDGMKALFAGTHVIPIGSQTESYLNRLGIDTDDTPSEFSSSGLVSHISGRYGRGNVLIVHSDHGSRVLDDGLAEAGMNVSELIAYRLTKNTDSPEIQRIIREGLAGRVDVFAFTSPMSVVSFADASADNISKVTKGSKIAAIGRPTESQLASYGIKADIVPDKATFEHLLKKIRENTGDKMTKKGVMIVGHGSRYEYNKKVMELQADRLEAMGFGNVYIGFNETSHPFIEETLIKMADDGIEEIAAIPFFIASGLHITRDIPPKLRLKGDDRNATIDVNGKKIQMHFGTPFGEDPLLARILHERIQELDSGKGRTGVMVVGHGSKLPYNKDTIILNAKRLLEMGHKDVRYAFNEFNDPKIEPVLEEMVNDGIDEIIVLPLFISLGDHLKNDIPEKIRLKDGVSEGTFDHNGRKITVKYALPIGQDPRLTDVLAEKIRAYY